MLLLIFLRTVTLNLIVDGKNMVTTLVLDQSVATKIEIKL